LIDRSRAIGHLPHQPQERDDVAAARPAVDDAVERRGVAAGVEAAEIGGRLGTHHREDALDRLQHAQHAAEGERSRHETDDLAVVVLRVAPDDLNRVGRRVGIVEVGIKPIEYRFQKMHGGLNSQLSTLSDCATLGDCATNHPAVDSCQLKVES